MQYVTTPTVRAHPRQRYYKRRSTGPSPPPQARIGFSVAEQSPRPRQHIGSGSGDGTSVADGGELIVPREGVRELDPCREMFVLVRERE
jgi:hypothetical protein